MRGRGLVVPAGVRPTESRVREALFSIWRERVPGARFLDLFAGSGAVGLEALSRGAEEIRFVEARRRIVTDLQTNAARLAESGWEVTRAELPAGLARLRGARFDLAFADPPYDFESYERVIAGVIELLEPAGQLAVEHSVRVTLPDRVDAMELVDQRIYGESSLSLYRPLRA